MKNASNKKSKISTPKKVALAVLGALTLLTIVNLIEAGVNKNHSDVVVFHENIDRDVERAMREHEKARQLHEEARAHAQAHAKEHDFDVKFEFNIDDKKFDINVNANNLFDDVTDGEVMIDSDFNVSEGELLSVQVGDADINIETHNSNEARVVVKLDGKDMRRAREYFENQNFEILHRDGALYVHTNPVKRNYSGDNSGGARIFVDIDIPRIFDADIKTSDGNIMIADLEGDVSLHTSDGDIVTRSLLGSTISLKTSDGDISTSALEANAISLRTSDGDIKVEDLISKEILISTSDGDIRGNSLEGVAAVSTSDGDIFLSSLRGDELNLRTSDGEIVVEEIVSKVSKVQTSDGSIILNKVSGDLTAKTSSGDLRVSLLDATNVYLRAGDGNIQVEAPRDYAATLFLKGERVLVSPGFGFTGDIKDDTADGKINGGGYTFEARTSDGEVIFREN